MRVLVINAGSSSVKLRLVDGDDRVEAAADLPARGGQAGEDGAKGQFIQVLDTKAR